MNGEAGVTDFAMTGQALARRACQHDRPLLPFQQHDSIYCCPISTSGSALPGKGSFLAASLLA